MTMMRFLTLPDCGHHPVHARRSHVRHLFELLLGDGNAGQVLHELIAWIVAGDGGRGIVQHPDERVQ
jgi:hypothetical protein